MNWLAIMNNCTEAVEIRETLREIGSVGVLKDLHTSDCHEDSLLLLALSTLLNLIPDYEIKTLKVNKNVLKLLHELLTTTAMKPAGKLSSRIEFAKAGKSLTITAYDLTKCIHDVANNDDARKNLVHLGVASILFQIVEKGSKCEKEISLDAMWQLADHQTVSEFMTLPGIDLMGRLRQLKETEDTEVKQAATRLHVRLLELGGATGYGKHIVVLTDSNQNRRQYFNVSFFLSGCQRLPSAELEEQNVNIVTSA